MSTGTIRVRRTGRQHFGDFALRSIEDKETAAAVLGIGVLLSILAEQTIHRCWEDLKTADLSAAHTRTFIKQNIDAIQAVYWSRGGEGRIMIAWDRVGIQGTWQPSTEQLEALEKLSPILAEEIREMFAEEQARAEELQRDAAEHEHEIASMEANR